MSPRQFQRRATGRAKKIRYAVVGLGHIAQTAVLPAFAHARRNSELVALVSDDPVKLKKLGRKYEVRLTFEYGDYDELMRSAEVDAVYIALPNHLHLPYTTRAAEAGVHVLCEKPMALDEDECETMIRATDKGGVKLMIAYRLHFEEANLRAIEIVKSGKLGEPRMFHSVFANPVEAPDVRLERELGGGTLFDIGIYCINAARYLFRAEPIEVFAMSANSDPKRFAEVDEMTGAILRFPGDRLATFLSSFGAADYDSFQVHGTKGSIEVAHAFGIGDEKTHRVTINERTRERKFRARDQFAPELLYFSDCILQNRTPEPSGQEGLADVRVIRALHRSIEKKGPVTLEELQLRRRPDLGQEIERPPVVEPELIHTAEPGDKR